MINSKMLKTATVVVGLLIVLVTIHGLFTGAAWLSYLIFDSIPLGNITVWASLIALSIMNFMLLAKHKFISHLALVLLCLSILWYPVGIIWSGNFNLNFTSLGEFWFPLSLGLAAACLLLFLLSLLLLVCHFIKSKQAHR